MPVSDVSHKAMQLSENCEFWKFSCNLVTVGSPFGSENCSLTDPMWFDKNVAETCLSFLGSVLLVMVVSTWDIKFCNFEPYRRRQRVIQVRKLSNLDQ